MNDQEEQKKIVKEAIHEWLEEKYALVGKWTIGGVLALLVAGAVYLVLWSQGWHKP